MAGKFEFNRFTGLDSRGKTRKQVYEEAKASGQIDASDNVVFAKDSEAASNYKGFLATKNARETIGDPKNKLYVEDRKKLLDHMNKNGTWKTENAYVDGKAVTKLYWEGTRGANGPKSGKQYVGYNAGHNLGRDTFFKDGDFMAGSASQNIVDKWDRGYEYIMGEKSRAQATQQQLDAKKQYDFLNDAIQNKDRKPVMSPGQSWYNAMKESKGAEFVNQDYEDLVDIAERTRGYYDGVPEGPDRRDAAEWRVSAGAGLHDARNARRKYFEERGITYGSDPEVSEVSPAYTGAREYASRVHPSTATKVPSSAGEGPRSRPDIAAEAASIMNEAAQLGRGLNLQGDDAAARKERIRREVEARSQARMAERRKLLRDPDEYPEGR